MSYRRTPRPAAGLALPLAVLICGCAGSGASVQEIESGRAEMGSLEAGVLGAAGDVSFFVDGERVRSIDGWSWWKDARLVLELPAGTHTVEARFPIGRFAGRELWSRVVTREPIPVLAGRRTRLESDLRGQWADPPEERVFTFQVTAPRIADERPDGTYSGPSTDQVPVEVRLAWLEPGLAAELLGPDVPLVPLPEGGRLAAHQITIRGDEVLAGGRLPPPGKPHAASSSSTRAPSAASSVAPDGPAGVDVVLLVETEPPGAHASLDDAYLGRTPVRVRIDPRADHLLRFEREGCEVQVQLLESADWKSGRRPRVIQRLDCR